MKLRTIIKKVLLLFIGITISTCGSRGFSYADTEGMTCDESSENEYRYTYVGYVSCRLSVSGNMMSWKTSATLKNQQIDYAVIRSTLVKKGGGLLKSFSDRVYPSGGVIQRSRSYTVSSAGTYYVSAIIKIYKNGQVVETISVASAEVSR